MRHLTPIAYALPFLLLAACGGERMVSPEQSYTVSSEVVGTSHETIERDLAGVIRGEMEALVAPEIAGRLQDIYVEVGEEVRKGQALARIEGTSYWLSSEAARGQFEATKLQLKQAEDNYNRYKPLHDTGSISAAQWENISNAYEAAQINYDASQAGYYRAADTASETTIRAPIAGVVAVRNFDIGSMVGPSYQVFEIVKTDPMKVSIGVNEEDIGTVLPASEVEVTVDAYPDEVFRGVVYSIGVKADSRTHAFPVEVRLENPDGRLKSGMVAHVRLPIKDLGEVLTIPINAAVRIQEVDYVFVVKEVVEDIPITGEDGKPGPSEPTTRLRVQRRAVTLGPETDHRVVVVEGLETGEEIVTEGQQFLEDSSLVTIPNRESGAEKAAGEGLQ
ncbi:MAG TPA: efflux RND transporter periplasmic adaptor subunit [bacterium]|nr:efflux RND transporter periplasmic adaptor subunit [bacterium]